MLARNWLLVFAGALLGGGGMVVGFNIAVDPYGIYRDTHGRKLPAYGDPRVAKYLLSERYVPENFNAILIGSSLSANWDMRGVEKLRVYNESVNGGNIVEQKALVDAALSRPGIAVAMLILHPFSTYSHDFKTVRLEPSLRFASLGSDSLLTAYKEMARVRLHHASYFSVDFAGTETFERLPTRLNPTMQKLFRPGMPFDVDPVALAALRDLVAELRAHRLQIVFIFPPMSEKLFVAQQNAFRDYLKLIAANTGPEEMLIDFESDDYAGFRRKAQNFGDGVHIYPESAALVVADINRKINAWIAEGRLRQPPPPR